MIFSLTIFCSHTGCIIEIDITAIELRVEFFQIPDIILSPIS